ncbi:hypothetical protein CTI12_AA354140 [Artemisia annua]|uniref:Uncharacterized protein n=1 Tax=Artemisia annua TaxID=35608 RepID=A0A2U1MQ02_ARTAN|nr:hypothetical protein CTI12_AA354140 [Artemisia annua]
MVNLLEKERKREFKAGIIGKAGKNFASQYVKSGALDPMLDDIKVVARCISKWKPHTFGKPSDGNRVHCTCKKDHINKFQLLIDEGSCYRIGNFGVGENGGNYPLLSHRYKLNLYKNSSVTRLASFDNNVRGFKFEPFSNLYVRQFSELESVDVIGTIVSISDLIPFTKGIQLQCCFFDAWASKFDKLHAQREKVGHVVMILQLAKVSYFGDKPSVTNAMWGSKLYMNEDIPEINSFRQMYESQDGYDPAKHSISVYSSAKKELTSEDFFKGAVKKMVGSIRDTEDEYNCIIYAKIHKIHREHGWAYLACKRCGCKATEIEKKQTSLSSSKFKKQQTWNCKKHKEITAVGMKMKVIVRVIDDTGYASLVMFDDMIAKLCGVDCYGLIKEYGPEVDDYFPAELNTLIGKKLLFRFEYTDFNVSNNNHVYQIKLISDEETMISYFKKDFIIEFAEWILNIGEGKIGGKNDGHAEVEFPEEMLIPDSDDHVGAIIKDTYDNWEDNLWDPLYFQDRAILAPTHEQVDKINDRMMSKLEGREKSQWLGHPFEYDGVGTDYAIRFCKDVESRAQQGYVGFGRFDGFNYFVAGSGRYDFVQEFYNGDLQHCETSHDKRGRTAQLNIICGDCPNGRCKSGLDCVCNVTSESDCRVIVELAIACEKSGQRVFEGFTVGFHPRSWEVVYNGMTQYGYEKAYKDYSFDTDQSQVSLYMTAIASVSKLVQKPSVTVSPETGLEVTLSGSGADGSPPTTLSPTLLDINWRCETARDSPYEVQLTIPVEGYDPIQFSLTKMCDSWSFRHCCAAVVLFTKLKYKNRLGWHGIDALPGMTILSACLETVSGVGGGSGYMRPDDLNNAYASQATWTREPASTPGSSRTSERRYGT